MSPFASMADAPPTEGDRELFGRLVQEIQMRADAVARIKAEEYAALLDKARLIG